MMPVSSFTRTSKMRSLAEGIPALRFRGTFISLTQALPETYRAKCSIIVSLGSAQPFSQSHAVMAGSVVWTMRLCSARI
jgi:hypothetical protein